MRRLHAKRRIIKALLARFAKDRSGALLSLEFALVGPVFIGLMLALFELGLLMVKTAMLDLAVAEATKSIYTGAAQTGGQTQDDIKAYICEKSMLFTNCENNITVELTPIADFASAPTAAAQCIDSNDGGAIAPAVDYSAGNGGAIMFMRVCVTTNVVMPGLGLGVHLVKSGTNRMQVVSSAAFMNEPF